MLLTSLGFPLETVLVFVVLVVVAMAVDYWVHKGNRVLSLKSASLWSLFWILVSVAFGMYLWTHHGAEEAELFFAGYLLEKNLSVDNLFVIMAIFTWFKVPERARHRVLFWGIWGAILFRLLFVLLGTGLMAISPYMDLLFALCVAGSACMMLRDGEDDDGEEENYADHLANRLVHRYFPVFPRLCGSYFFIRHESLAKARSVYPDVQPIPAGINPKDSKQQSFKRIKKDSWIATSLFLCLATIELTDAMFAFDSVPAVLAVSREPVIVYSAMILAILGLRSMYFVLEALRDYLVHMEKAVIILLFFIAFKLIFSASNHVLHHGWEISPTATLVVIMLVLGSSVVASFLLPEKN